MKNIMPTFLTKLLYVILVKTILILLAGLQIAHANDDLIPYQQFQLDNGLTLIVHEDHKAPIVAVNIWYHVGSRNERPGQTGYAHLFEHLMFQGSQNSGGEYLPLLEKVGATTLNGTTWFDRTNYYQTVPVGALDRVLFLESDRMGHMLEAIDQAVLDEQRGVVQNEKREGENQPYDKVWKHLLEQVFTKGHPYSWETIGSMEDLEAASLEEMQEWFRTYYGPNNAVLVLAGDIKPEQALERVTHWFGDIPAGPPLEVDEEWIPRHTSEQRQLLQDRVPQERIYMAWTGPRWGTRDAHQLQLATDILAFGKNSRLYERLVYRDRIATDVSLMFFPFEIAGLIALEISVKQGTDIELAERIAREEIQHLIDAGPTRKELRRIQTETKAAFVRGVESVGGPGSKSAVLAENAVYGNDPGFYRQQLADIAAATTRDLRAVSARWLGQPPYVAHVVPYPELTAATEGADRSAIPAASDPEAAVFPDFTSIRLDNGLRIVVAERPTVPVVNMSLIFDAGYSADKPELTGEASMTMAMLDEGAGKLKALEISEELAMLGANLSTGIGLDSASVNLSALTENLDASLDLFARVVLDPTFPVDELERLRAQTLTNIQQEKSDPFAMALRLLPGLLYGKGHAYAQPLTGSGTEASVAAINRDNLVAWHDTWFRPNNATLIATGDITLAELQPRIKKLFHNWEAAEVPAKNITDVADSDNDTLYVIDKPGAQQSIIFAGQLILPLDNPDEIAVQTFNDILGGQFSSRVNMNLREEKHWSYGARSTIMKTRSQRPYILYAPVQTDKTSESLSEILREVREIASDNPPTSEELERVQKSRTLSLPGRWETSAAVLAAISEIISYDLPEDYWNNYADRINELDLDGVSEVAANTVDPETLIWVVVGDYEVIEDGLRRLGIGDIQLIDTDGVLVD